MHLKGGTVSGVASPTVKAPGARAGGTKQLVPRWVISDCAGGGDRLGRQSPSPSQTAGRERGAAMELWVPWPRESCGAIRFWSATPRGLYLSPLSMHQLLCQCPVGNNGRQTQPLLLLSCAAFQGWVGGRNLRHWRPAFRKVVSQLTTGLCF